MIFFTRTCLTFFRRKTSYCFVVRISLIGIFNRILHIKETWKILKRTLNCTKILFSGRGWKRFSPIRGTKRKWGEEVLILKQPFYLLSYFSAQYTLKGTGKALSGDILAWVSCFSYLRGRRRKHPAKKSLTQRSLLQSSTSSYKRQCTF